MAQQPGTVQTTARGEAFVADRLAHTEQRIRFLDLAAAGLGFAAGTCAYAAAMLAVDSFIARAEFVRQLLFLGYVACAAGYLTIFVVRPLTRRINPYFAARQVERSLPGAKNSVVNWIDLHGQPLPPAIRNALGVRAAKDLARVDIEQAVSGRRAGIAGGVAALAAGLLFAMLLSFGARPFFDGIKRAFAPFAFSGPARTRTQVTLLRPEAGNATVPVGRGISIAVEVSGKVPDPKGPEAVRLLYRYGDGDPWLERPLTEESGSEFATTVSASEVRSGFWYKVSGGDSETAEYRVGVRSTPQIVEFQATYHFPKYAAWPKETRRDRALRAVRGSDVVLWALTNRTVHEAHLDFDGKAGRKTFHGEVVPGDSQAFQVRLPLQESGQYHLVFASAEGDSYSEPVSTVEVLDDNPPHVELTKPGRDVQLPANGLLSLEGLARDDFGVREITLHMKAGDRTLKPQPYRSAAALRLENGGYPQVVTYKDAVDFTKLEAEDAGPFHAQTGMDIVYWLQAVDACEPKANDPGKSASFHVKLTEPQKDEAKQKQDREQAKKEQAEHAAKQDQQLKQESETRKEQSKQADQNEQDHGKQKDKKDKSEQGSKSGASGQPDNKDAGSKENADPSQAKPDGNDRNGGKENKGEAKQENARGGDNAPEDARRDAENREKADRLNDVLNKKPGDGQGSPEQNQTDKGGDNQRKEGEKSGAKDNAQKSGKENGSKSPDNKSRGDKSDQQPNGDKNGNDSSNGKQSGEKPDGKNSPKQDGNQSRDKSASSERSPDGKDGSGEGSNKQDAGSQDKGDKGSAKDKADGGPKSGQPNARQSEKDSKENRQPMGSGEQKPGEPKESASQNSTKNGAENKPKPEPGREPAGNKGTEKNPDQKPGNPRESSSDPERTESSQSGDRRQADGTKSAGDKGQQSGQDAAKGDKQGGKAPGKSDGDKKSSAPGDSKGDKGDAGPKKPDGSDKGSDGSTKPQSDSKNGNAGDKQQDKGASSGDRANQQPGKDGGNTPVRPEKSLSADKGGTPEKHSEQAPHKDGASGGKGDAKDARPDDVKNAAKDLQSNDAKKREEAREKLDRMSKQARDEQTREDARQALEKGNKGESPGDSKDSASGQGNSGNAPGARLKPEDGAAGNSDKPQGEDGPTGDKAAGDKSAGDKKQNSGGKAASKDKGDNRSPANGKTDPTKRGDGDAGNVQESPNEKKGDGTKPDGEKKGEKSQEKAARGKGGDALQDKSDGNKLDEKDKPPQPNEKGNPPAKDPNGEPKPSDETKTGVTNPRRDPNNLPEPPAPDPVVDKSKPRHQDKRTELQLQDLDKVTKKDLEAAKLTEQDLAALKKWLQDQQKQKPTADPKDLSVAPQRGGPGGPISAGRVQPGTAGKPNDLSGGGRAQPPPGYREANEAFKRLINKSDPNAP